MSFNEISREFDRESFDYVFTMGALQYFNERKYFQNISHVLKMNGRIVIFWCHYIGYYIRSIPKRLRKRDLKPAVSFSAAIVLGLMEPAFSFGRDHVVTYGTSRRIAWKYGIELRPIAFTPLCHKYFQEKFMNLAYVSNMFGTKTKEKSL
jgi:SAM-dependent methyltransferase